MAAHGDSAALFRARQVARRDRFHDDPEGDWRRLDQRGFPLGRSGWRALLGVGPEHVAPGPLLLLGRCANRDEVLLRILARYPGGVVLIDHGRLADRLARGPAFRFEPGAPFSVGFNPLAVIRSGDLAWHDLVLLAAELVGEEGEAVVESVAAVLGDHLIGSTPERRTLAALRRRLFDGDGVLRGIMAGFEGPISAGLAPTISEIIRVRQSWSGSPDVAHAAVERLRGALAGLSDGRLAEVTGRQDIDPADLVRGVGPSTLALMPIVGSEIGRDPVLSAIIGQVLDALIAVRVGGAPCRRVALVVSSAMAMPAPLLLRKTWGELAAIGLDLLVAADSIDDARGFLGGRAWDDMSARGEPFSTVVLAGPCGEVDARALSHRAGRTERIRTSLDRGWPTLRRVVLPRLAPERLMKAPAGDIWIVGGDIAPARARIDATLMGAVQIARSRLSPRAPAWSEPPQKRRAPAANAPRPEPPPPPPRPPRAPLDVREVLKAKSGQRRRPNL
ncbi:MAG: hypothetical protein KJS97_10590 [Alphaproteobacteria bacterium]|nr:hypothetical protein [Alphaproteobacteria bacterium]